MTDRTDADTIAAERALDHTERDMRAILTTSCGNDAKPEHSEKTCGVCQMFARQRSLALRTMENVSLARFKIKRGSEDWTDVVAAANRCWRYY